ncbi:MAG TPA: hypothetical protein VFV70_02010 [Hyphomonadaceae bacterium]|nr:hypothetical protein [Hyphomonadaceae bacterium]
MESEHPTPNGTPAQEQPAAAAVQPAQKATLEPPSYWSKERKEAFRYQPRHVQEEWLGEDPTPSSRWSAEIQEAFNKLPTREAKELYLTQITDIERGVHQKFQSLAAERKLAEDIRAAVPPHVRTYMDQKGLNEAQVLGTLLNLQQQSMQDPAGYIRRFVENNKLNPAELFGIEARPSNEPPSLDVIRSHPEYQQIATQFDALRREVQQERTQRAEEENRRLAAEFEQIVQDRDGDGEPLYPYIRLLADPMARILDSDPERFSSMATRDRFATAYRMALEEFPELKPLKRPAVPPPADEQVVKDAHAVEEEKRAGNLERAITPKPRSPLPMPQGPGKTGDPLEDALNAATRKLGLTR